MVEKDNRFYIKEFARLENEEIEKTFEVARRMAREEGLFIGMSSAAIMYVALEKAKEMGKDKVIVAILPDNGDKYLSTKLFE